MDRIPSRYHFPSPGFAHYWKHGHGKRLAAPFPDAFASEAEIRQLIPLLFRVDAAADRVVREVLLVTVSRKRMRGSPPDFRDICRTTSPSRCAK